MAAEGSSSGDNARNNDDPARKPREIFINRAKVFERAHWPFHSHEGVLHYPHVMSLSLDREHTVKTRYVFTLRLPPSFLQLLRSEKASNNDIYLRCFEYSSKEVVRRDNFPPNCIIKVADQVVQGATYPDRPLIITQHVIDKLEAHKFEIKFDWTSDTEDDRKWAVAIYKGDRVSFATLLDKITNSTSKYLPHAESEAMIKKRFVKEEDDLLVDSDSISLICPLAKSRIRIPVRSRGCTHFECFDLETFLKFNEVRPTWKCCHCERDAFYKTLVIDSFFQKILADLGESTTEVELLRDGTYREVSEGNDLSDVKKSKCNTEVIELDDDENEKKNDEEKVDTKPKKRPNEDSTLIDKKKRA